MSPKGWAIECRITAEDPFNNFLPSAGLVTYLKEPTGPGVRVESALYRGAEISLYYDPMVAKLVVYGESRAEAILRMKRALAEYRIGGIKTSIPFHQHIMDSTEFIWGTFDTGFLSRRTLRKQEQAHEESERVAAVAAALIAHEEKRKAAVLVGGEESSNGNGAGNGSGSLWKSVGTAAEHKGAPVRYYARVGEREFVVDVENDGSVQLDGEPMDVDLRQVGADELYSMLIAGKSHEMLIEARRYTYDVMLRGEFLQVQVEDERARRLSAKRKVSLPDGEIAILAPIPGLIVKVLVAEGDEVAAEQPVILLEAMKMENELRAARAGRVKLVKVAPGQRVEQNSVLLVLE